MSQNAAQSRTLAGIYAEAVWPLADSAEARRRLIAQMRELAGALAAEPETLRWLDNPAVDRSARRETIFKTLDGRVDDLLRDAAAVMARRGRLALLGEVADELERLQLADEGVKIVSVATATDMDEATRRQVLDWIAGRYGASARTSFLVDPEILGGLVIRCGDDVTDLSLKKEFLELTQRLGKAAGRTGPPR